MKKSMLVLILLVAVILSGCECTSGFGRDMQKAGNWVERNADRANPGK